MTAGMCCALRSWGGTRERPPPSYSAIVAKEKPPGVKGHRRKSGGTQHTPAASLGAVGQHRSSQTAKNTHCQELCCVHV